MNETARAFRGRRESSQHHTPRARGQITLRPAARPPAAIAAAALLIALAFSAAPARAQTCSDSAISPDGPVNAIVVSGNTVYIGGGFGFIGPCTGHGVMIDATTGAVAPGFPKVAGPVETGAIMIHAVVSDGAGGWFLGGNFTSVGGLPRAGLAHVRSDLTVSPWNPGADYSVDALALSGSTLYVGGSFQTIGGASRFGLAAVDATTGTTTAWEPDPNDYPLAMAVAGTKLYVCGNFTTIGATSRVGITRFDIPTGNLDAWNPGSDGYVGAFALGGATVYVAGGFAQIGGQERPGMAGLKISDATATSWDPWTDGTISTMAVSGSTVYVGGGFSEISGVARNNLAAIGSNGQPTSWNPNPDDYVDALLVNGTQVLVGGNFLRIAGVERSRIAGLNLSNGAAVAWNPGAGGEVYALAVNGTIVFAGGNFDRVGGVARSCLAAIDATTGLPTSWNPGTDNTVHALAVSGSKVYVGGLFNTIAGQPRNALGAVDATTGALSTWNPDILGIGSHVKTLALSGPTLYAGGFFTLAGGLTRNSLAALDTATGVPTAWNPDPGHFSTVNDLLVRGNTIYVGGDFGSIGGVARNRIAAINTLTGAATPFNPNASGNVVALAQDDASVYAGGEFVAIGGASRFHLAALDPVTGAAHPGWDATPGGSPDNVVAALAASGNKLYVGGDFTAMDGTGRSYIAALVGPLGDLTPWNPGTARDVFSLASGAGKIWAGGTFGLTALNPDPTAVTAVDSRPAGVGPLRVAPNPSTGSVHVWLEVPRAGRVRVGVVDLLGRNVATLADEVRPAGAFDLVATAGAGGSALKPGVYFVRAELPGEPAPIVARVAVVR